jgi:hypothetical protein
MSVPILAREVSRKLELFPIETLLEAAEKQWEGRSPSMLAASYNKDPVDLVSFIPTHLSREESASFLRILEKRRAVFDGQLGNLPGDSVELYLKDKAVVPYHGRAFSVPKVHDKLLRMEISRLESLGVLKRVNGSEWAAPSFGIPKKNGQIRFVSDFRQLNKH